MFFPPLKKTFDTFDIHLTQLENQKFFIHKLLCKLMCVDYHFKDIEIVIFINSLIDNGIFKFNQRVQMMMTF
jgi:hypothetical protein